LIFISYRRTDANALVARLAKDLRSEFGEEFVFRDKQRLPGSQDWPQDIQDQASACQVMLVAIGKTWQTVLAESGDYKGFPRLFDPQDWVRREISLGLKDNRLVVPVLLEDAEMPTATWLKLVELEGLSKKHTQQLRTDDYETDLGKLIAIIREKCPGAPPKYDSENPAQIPDQRSGRAPPTHPAAKPVIPAEYLARLSDECADIGLLGLKLRQGQAVKLNHVYVPLITPAGDEERSAKLGNIAGDSDEKAPPALLLSLLAKESLYVAGSAGSGKSTFCRWVAWLACSASLPESSIPAPEGYGEEYPDAFHGRLPLLVRLRDFWPYLPQVAGTARMTQQELENSLERWTNATRPGGVDWGIVGPHLERDSLLLLLDGLDEVPLSHACAAGVCQPRAMLLTGLTSAAKAWTERGHRLLLTSRPYGVSDEEARRLGLRQTPLAELDEPLRELLVQRWFQCLIDSADRAAATATQMLEHVAHRGDLAPLTANPMLLTAMCIVYSEGGRLPQDRYDVYDRIVDNVLFNRFPQDRTVIEPVRNRLAVVAYGMHTGEGLGEARQAPQARVTLSEIDRMIQAYQDRTSWTESDFTSAVTTREQLLTHSGLLLPQGERQAGFYHLTIQDYLAAQRLLDICEDRLLSVFCERSAAPEWRGTLSFVFGSQLAKRSSPERSITLLSQLVEQLDQQAVGLSLVVADCLQILLKRGLRLKDVLEKKFWEYCVEAIEREVALPARYDLAATLGHLGDPRIVTDLREPAAYVEIPAGAYRVGDNVFSKEMQKTWGAGDWALSEQMFILEEPLLLAKYPVTNLQYNCFMESGGYSHREWWSEEGWNWRQDRSITAPGFWHDGKWNLPNQPVIGVSYYEAEAFAKWAGGRLPREQEWEAAARGQDALDYPWGNKEQWQDLICNSSGSGLQATSPVGLFPRSRSRVLGLEDLAGNVWEWCDDWFAVDAGASARVFRGGSWYHGALNCRSAFRSGYSPGIRNGRLGFRVARSSVG
jgi:formylglycine-generating enzyme required for sulfatase activity